MLILVGLGNPEPKYQGNRHNLGFRAVETIADRWSFSPARKRFQSAAREGAVPTPTASFGKPSPAATGAVAPPSPGWLTPPASLTPMTP